MWFYWIILIFVLLATLGIVFGGGIYTLILIPLILVAIVSAIGYAIWIRSQSQDRL